MQQVEYESQRAADREQALRDIEESRQYYEDPNADDQENRERFFKSSSKHNPEQRLEAARKAIGTVT